VPQHGADLVVRPGRRAAHVEDGFRVRRRDVPADAGLEHRRGDGGQAEHRMRAIGEE
jgi:hypothetical protein